MLLELSLFFKADIKVFLSHSQCRKATKEIKLNFAREQIHFVAKIKLLISNKTLIRIVKIKLPYFPSSFTAVQKESLNHKLCD
jgi:hypothetical protein